MFKAIISRESVFLHVELGVVVLLDGLGSQQFTTVWSRDDGRAGGCSVH